MEFLPISGIYKITNVVTGDTYVGASSDLQKRKRTHLSALRSKNHKNRHLQASWDANEEISFQFEVLEYVDEADLMEMEQFYIDTLNPSFNIQRVAGGSPSGIVRTEEAKKRMSIAATGRVLSDETKRKIGIAKTGNKNCVGRVMSEETKRKIGAKSKGRVFSEESRKKMSDSQKARYPKPIS